MKTAANCQGRPAAAIGPSGRASWTAAAIGASDHRCSGTSTKNEPSRWSHETVPFVVASLTALRASSGCCL